jgi:hypothetical protein
MDIFEFGGEMGNAINAAIQLFYPVIVLGIILFLVACFFIAVVVVFVRFVKSTA